MYLLNLCFEFDSVPKQTCLDTDRNDDEMIEYSRSSSDVLNWNSKQKKKGNIFFTFLQSDFKLIELGTYYLVIVQILKKTWREA